MNVALDTPPRPRRRVEHVLHARRSAATSRARSARGDGRRTPTTGGSKARRRRSSRPAHVEKQTIDGSTHREQPRACSSATARPSARPTISCCRGAACSARPRSARACRGCRARIHPCARGKLNWLIPFGLRNDVLVRGEAGVVLASSRAGRRLVVSLPHRRRPDRCAATVRIDRRAAGRSDRRRALHGARQRGVHALDHRQRSARRYSSTPATHSTTASAFDSRSASASACAGARRSGLSAPTSRTASATKSPPAFLRRLQLLRPMTMSQAPIALLALAAAHRARRSRGCRGGRRGRVAAVYRGRVSRGSRRAWWAFAGKGLTLDGVAGTLAGGARVQAHPLRRRGHRSARARRAPARLAVVAPHTDARASPSCAPRSSPSSRNPASRAGGRPIRSRCPSNFQLPDAHVARLVDRPRQRTARSRRTCGSTTPAADRATRCTRCRSSGSSTRSSLRARSTRTRRSSSKQTSRHLSRGAARNRDRCGVRWNLERDVDRRDREERRRARRRHRAHRALRRVPARRRQGADRSARPACVRGRAAAHAHRRRARAHARPAASSSARCV